MSAPQNKFTVQVLGGQSSIGSGNCQRLCHFDDASNESVVTLDIGTIFGDSDRITPDFIRFLAGQPGQGRVILTHSHYDHFGAIDALLRAWGVPVQILASRWTSLFVKDFLDQPALRKTARLANFTQAAVPTFTQGQKPSGWYHWGKTDAVVGLFPWPHSTPEARGLVVFHTPDLGSFVWMVDLAEPDNPEQEIQLIDTLQRITTLPGGVVACFVDSTGAAQEKNHRKASEAGVYESIRQIIANAQKVVYFSTFSSNAKRIQQAALAAKAEGRKFAYVAGQSLRRTIGIACTNIDESDQPYINGSATYDYNQERWIVHSIEGLKVVNLKTAIDLQETQPDQLIVFIAGTQAEGWEEADETMDYVGQTSGSLVPASALTRLILYGLRPHASTKALKLQPGDTVIISASEIPTNVDNIQELKTAIRQQGAFLFDDSNSGVHMSGHATNLTGYVTHLNPRVVVPIHGDAITRGRMGQAVQAVLPNVQILQVDDGQDGQEINFTLDEFGQVSAQIQDIAGLPKSETQETRVHWFGTHLTVIDVEVRSGHVYRLVRPPVFDRSVKDEYGLSDTIERLVLGYLNQITEDGVPRTKITPGALQRDIREMLLVVLKDQIQLPSVFYPFVKIHDVTDLLAGSATEQVSS